MCFIVQVDSFFFFFSISIMCRWISSTSVLETDAVWDLHRMYFIKICFITHANYISNTLFILILQKTDVFNIVYCLLLEIS
jgi:hypothetical protein